MGFSAFFMLVTKNEFGAKTQRETIVLKSPKSCVEPLKLPNVQKSSRRSHFSTEQIKLKSFSSLRKEVHNEDINLRVLLLSPLPDEDATSWEKSTINTSSHSGSVTIEIIRLSGAANHHFRYSARVILPSKFRGNVYINSARSMPIHVKCSAELRKSIDVGVVRLNAPGLVRDDEDEVHIYAARSIKLQMQEEVRDQKNESLWILESRLSRIRRMFKMP
ncbi:hypothetical protein BDZ97DRAFT_1857755 [Flammula alnicola]|nr:hypothetical protein BDZ97DRAFT_1857755 [Flammula alnicola]